MNCKCRHYLGIVDSVDHGVLEMLPALALTQTFCIYKNIVQTYVVTVIRDVVLIT